MAKFPATVLIIIIVFCPTGFCHAQGAGKAETGQQLAQLKAEPIVRAELTDPNEESLPELDLKIKSGKQAIDRQFEYIFTTYVDEAGNVDYQTLRRKRADLIPLLRKLNNLHPAEIMSWSQKEKMAFWINAHNIFTLKLIIDNYPIEPRWYLINYPDSSLMQIPGGRTKRYFKVMGMEYTLREIEREILLKRFGDPRVCFTLSYASAGGAFLRNEAYRADKLDEQLDEQTKRFLADPRGLKIDHVKKVFFISDIFSWYEEYYVEKYGQVKRFRDRNADIQAYLNFIVDRVSADTAKQLKTKPYPVRSLMYNWHLNEQIEK
jgi:hypothetical protein